MRLRAWSPLVLVLLAGAVACDVQVRDDGVSVGLTQGRARDEWARTYTLPRDGRLEIINVNGPIEVSAAAPAAAKTGPATGGGQVEVHAERQARASSEDAARALLSGSTIAEQVERESVRIETQADTRGNSRALMESVSVRYIVKVPAGLVIRLRTQNGAISVENTRGRMSAETTNGGVRVAGLSGSLTASTVNGGIAAALTAVDGPIDIRAVNGGIRLALPPDVRGALTAETVNGGVSIDERLMPKGDDLQRDPRRVAGLLGGGGPDITVQATNGGVRVVVGGDADDARPRETRPRPARDR